MRLLGNLGIQSITLFPAEELRFDGEGYLVLMLQEGQAYWLEAEASAMVERGQLLVVPRGGDRCLRGGAF